MELFQLLTVTSTFGLFVDFLNQFFGCAVIFKEQIKSFYNKSTPVNNGLTDTNVLLHIFQRSFATFWGINRDRVGYQVWTRDGQPIAEVRV